MAALSRTAQFTRLHKILARHYKPVTPDGKRSVLEHLLFACCLENAHYDAAEEAFAAMVDSFFDWNEIRVSTVRELSEVMPGLPDPRAAAQRFKRVLQNIFEASYSFDLEELRKLSLGAAQERLQKIDGTTKFAIAYVTQAALGGHAIPLDSGTLEVLALVNLASEAEKAAGSIAGLERAIPKTAGVEFASLLHQLGADYVATPFSRSLHQVLLEIDPSVAERLPCRRTLRVQPMAAPEPAPQASTEKAPSTKRKPALGKPAAGKPAPGKPSARKPAPAAGKPAAGQPAPREPAATPPGATQPAGASKPARKTEKARGATAAEASSSADKGVAQGPGSRPASERKKPKGAKSSTAPPTEATEPPTPVAPPGAAIAETSHEGPPPLEPAEAPPAIEGDGVLSSGATPAGAAPAPTPVTPEPAPAEAGPETPAGPPAAESPAAPLPGPGSKAPAGPRRPKGKPPSRPRVEPGTAGTSPAAGLSKRKPR